MVDIPTQHAPAVKVAGRRLSTTTRPTKSHISSSPKETSAIEAVSDIQDEQVDYPRPAPPGTQHEANPNHVHHEEEVPLKKDKKHGVVHDDVAQRKAATTMPTKEAQIPNKGFGGGNRIAQPAGRALGA
ncbi:hypothetical protein C8J56DRAFT_938865 [Mycena floridula]|nr:hypothetical protein C8J56DRAFT_938865 [Mycena floridula]